VKTYGRETEATDDNIIRRMRIECWINNAKNTHLEYAILVGFPLQQWLQEHASMLLYKFIAYPVISCYIHVHVHQPLVFQTWSSSGW
jgi:hypothetical protein